MEQLLLHVEIQIASKAPMSAGAPQEEEQNNSTGVATIEMGGVCKPVLSVTEGRHGG